MQIDLENATLEELVDAKSKIEAAIKDLDARNRRKAWEKMHEIASEYGFKLNELLNDSAPKAKTALPLKYRNPSKPTQAWTGRGRRPQWFLELIEQGMSEDDLLIK